MPLHERSPGSDISGAQFITNAQPSALATLTFPNLDPTAFTFFQLTWFLDTSNAADQQLRCQVNGDTTSGHYGWALLDVAGNTSNGSDSSAVLGYIPASSQSIGTGMALIPAQHGGTTRNGSGFFAGNGVSTHQGTAATIWTFNIASNITSISLFAASGNLTGNVTLCGIP